MKSVVEYNTHYMEMEPQSTVVLSDSQLSKWLNQKQKRTRGSAHDLLLCYIFDIFPLSIQTLSHVYIT